MSPVHYDQYMNGFTTDPDAWVAAGGDAWRREVLARAGRVAVFTDGDARCLAAIHPDRPETGTVGDWVGGPEVLDEALGWLKAQGCTSAEGPALLAPWFPALANLGPFDTPPMIGEPTDRGARWEAAGWTRSARYVSIAAPHEPQIAAGMDRAARLSLRGWRLESLETGPSSQITEAAWDRAVGAVHEIATAAFRDLPGYLSVPADVVADFYRPHRQLVDPRLTLLARDPTGEAAGFLLGLPAHAGVLANGARWFQILTLGVRPQASHSGVATWMVAAVHQAARKAGYTAGVHATIRVEGSIRDTAWYRGDLVREYASYRKTW